LQQPKKSFSRNRANKRAATRKKVSPQKEILPIIRNSIAGIDPNTRKSFTRLIQKFNKGPGKGSFEKAKEYIRLITRPSYKWDPTVGPYADYTVASVLLTYFLHLRGFAEKKNAGKEIIQLIDGIVKKLSQCPMPH